jgi:predicted acylesterase/phospholipase RssA
VLTLEPARHKRAGGKLGIALAGGGPLGSFYEIGVLRALEESLVGRDLTGFDVYVGVSSGSVVAAALANGIDATSMGSLFIQDAGTLTPEILMQPAFGEYARRVTLLPAVILEMLQQLGRRPLHYGWPSVLGSLGRMIPTALFDNRPLERYLHEVFSRGGRSDDFRALRARLFVVATHLDTATAVAFGDRAHDEVPISRAVAASAALPGLYAPVEIAGEHYVDGALLRTMHASLALEAGCDLLLCINPLVPFDASRSLEGRHRNLAAKGLPTILGQTFRALIHSRMQVGVATYRARFPRADMLLIEPDRDDERLFFANVFRYSGRHALAEHAYQRTRRDLLLRAEELAPLLARHGLKLDERRLRERQRRFASSARERADRARHVTRHLARALSQLEREVGARA